MELQFQFYYVTVFGNTITIYNKPILFSQYERLEIPPPTYKHTYRTTRTEMLRSMWKG